MGITYDSVTETARTYYNSQDADAFYRHVWGGEDIHIGLYSSAEEPIGIASRRTVDHMLDRLGSIEASAKVLDIGSGYGGAARRIVERFGCQVVCLNLSETENEQNRQANIKAGVDQSIEVLDGRFEEIPQPGTKFDIVWSQDALLHSGDRRRVFQEVDRVLKPGGRFIFTDPMAADDCPAGKIAPILSRIHLSDMGSPQFYQHTASKLGWIDEGYEDQTSQLSRHYQRVLETTSALSTELKAMISAQYLDAMRTGLRHWVEGGKAGHLRWGIFLFKKPANKARP